MGIGTNPNVIAPEHLTNVITYFLDYEDREEVRVRKLTAEEIAKQTEDERMEDLTYRVEAFPKVKGE